MEDMEYKDLVNWYVIYKNWIVYNDFWELPLGSDGCYTMYTEDWKEYKVDPKILVKKYFWSDDIVPKEIKKQRVKMVPPDVSKAVIQLDKEGNKIATYASITEASEKTGVNRPSIWRVCKWYLRSAWGFKWLLL